MTSLYNINTIAHFESKILFRSWFLRIFVIVSLVILGFFNFALVSKITGTPSSFSSLPSFLPYLSLLMFNLVQAVVAIFLASDFAQRDKNLDTSKVIYARSVSNSEYIIGKTLGILYVFLIVNILVLVEVLVFNLISQSIPLHPLSYLLYPLLISLPTLIFIIGLSFILMAITRNQAVTFILLLIYVALTSFFLGQKLNNMLDFMAYRVPLGQSDFIGFGNLPEVLVHRGIYVLLGIGLIFLSIFLLDRLPQKEKVKMPLVISILFLITGFGLAGKYLNDHKVQGTLREQAIEINNKYTREPKVDILEYNIKVDHKIDKIKTKAKIIYTNPNEKSLSRIVLSLNSGFEITKISKGEEKIPFKREAHIILIDNINLAPGDIDSLEMHYMGKPEERTAYLDLDTAEWEEQFRPFLLNIDQRYGIVSSDYLLLTKEINWYPVAGVGYATEDRFNRNRDFAKYTLEVDTRPRFTAISQGKQVKAKKGRFIYKSEVGLPQISLTIGPYEKLSATIDSVEYALYRKKKHNYWTEYFPELKDTVDFVLKELFEDYERKLGLEYPFDKLWLVEVPIQFSAHPKMNTVAWEFSQPEIMLIPENGFLMFNSDLKTMKAVSRFRNRDQDLTEKEKQIKMLRNAFRATFTNGSTYLQTRTRRGKVSNYFSIFPLFYAHAYAFNSNEYAIIDQAIESHLNERISGQLNEFLTRRDGITAEEKANIYLQKGSLKYHLKNEKDRDNIQSMINVKGNYLFTAIEYKTGKEQFEEIVETILEENKHGVIEFTDFIDQIEGRYNWNMDTILYNWYNNDELAAYAFQKGDYYKVMKDNREMHQILFRLTNHSEIGGFVRLSFEQDGGRNRMGFGPLANIGSSDMEEFIYKLKGGETKEISVLLPERPRSYFINTMVSKNLPTTFQGWTQHFELKEDAVAVEGAKTIETPVKFIEEGEIIVDNEDKGFRFEQPESNKLITNLFKPRIISEFEYEPFYWQPKAGWSKFIDTEMYGKYVLTGHQTKPGKGDHKAIWVAELPKSGRYEVYTHLIKKFVHQWRRGRGRNRDNEWGSYEYTIYQDDGPEVVKVELNSIEQGWNSLGTFYFSGDSAKVELSNKGEPPSIILADAIKWVKK